MVETGANEQDTYFGQKAIMLREDLKRRDQLVTSSLANESSDHAPGLLSDLHSVYHSTGSEAPSVQSLLRDQLHQIPHDK